METTLVVATAFTAVGTVALAVATIYLAYKTGKMVEANRDTVEANREMVAEMKASRVAQERPQVIVDADYSRSPLIEVVIRNIGRGAAKDITFDFSAPMVSSMSEDEHSVGVPLNELSYFKEGMDWRCERPFAYETGLHRALRSGVRARGCLLGAHELRALARLARSGGYRAPQKARVRSFDAAPGRRDLPTSREDPGGVG